MFSSFSRSRFPILNMLKSGKFLLQDAIVPMVASILCIFYPSESYES